MKLLAPADFRTTHWKNGKGMTTELAISEGGTLAEFDWRISMASVVENGPFSDFCGYDRCLLLLKGAGLQLVHESSEGRRTTSSLKKPLDMATFDGGSHTTATLIDGPITDFNIMAKTGFWRADTRTSRTAEHLTLNPLAKTFVYAVAENTRLQSMNAEASRELPKGHLLQLEPGEVSVFSVQGLGCIVMEIYPDTR